MNEEQQPLSLDESAVGIHEAYMAYIRAGFAHNDALYIVACMASGGPKAPPS